MNHIIIIAQTNHSTAATLCVKMYLWSKCFYRSVEMVHTGSSTVISFKDSIMNNSWSSRARKGMDVRLSSEKPLSFFLIGFRTRYMASSQTKFSNAALLPYLTHHELGSAYEWSGVWNGPYSLLVISSRIKIGSLITIIGSRDLK